MDKQPASTMNYKEVLAELEEVYQNARPYMSPKCRVCKVCNSLNCKMIPTERSGSAIRNYEKLQQIKIRYDTIYEGGDGTEIDTSLEWLGHRCQEPTVMCPVLTLQPILPGIMSLPRHCWKGWKGQDVLDGRLTLWERERILNRCAV